ncbi:LysR family transcriptional regulator [Streptomyces sp. Ru73]|uniref:LysR family transcriptional regulator n=1 Tax=Streptomyces sp. Ru73 TaxID=2080748 RepID=UPI0015E39C19|nr:LysR family transcriptional regulator [Streptomyces sp. Ru73]
MELRDLEYFALVADELHYGRAAARLHVSPAAVRRRIRDLECELGLVLFDRTDGRLSLAPAGGELLPAARRALAATGEVEDAARHLRAARLGELRIGCAPGAARLVDALIGKVAREHADIAVLAAPMWSLQALDAVARGDLQLALVRDPLPPQGTSSLIVGRYRDEHVAVPAPGPLTRQVPVPLGAFEGLPFLINERDIAPGVHDATVRFFADHGVAPLWQHHRLREPEQVLSLVAAGTASALVHAHPADVTDPANVTCPGVAVLPLAEPGPEHRFHLVWRSDDSSPLLHSLIDLVCDHGCDLDEPAEDDVPNAGAAEGVTTSDVR